MKRSLKPFQKNIFKAILLRDSTISRNSIGIINGKSALDYSTLSLLSKNNNTLNHKMSTLNYSTRCLPKNYSVEEIVLDFLNIKQWSREEVCSLIDASKKDLNTDEITHLYDAKLDGIAIDHIISNIQQLGTNDLSSIYPINPIVVRWVNMLLKTRLYHLWSTEQVTELICKPIEEEGGIGISLETQMDLKLDGAKLVKLIEMIQRSEEYLIVEQFKNSFSKKQINLIIEWLKTEIIPLSHLKTIKNTTFDKPNFNDLAYQNNKETIKRMTTVFLENIALHREGSPIRFQKLLVNSTYCGMGKTRLGNEFLSQFQLLMNQDTNWKNEIEQAFSKVVIEQLEKSKTIYIHFRKVKVIKNDLSETFKNLKIEIEDYLGCTMESKPCFIILDGIGYFFASFIPKHIPGVEDRFSALYSILHEFILPFQQIPTVSLYVCGEYAYMEMIGRGMIPTLQSPTVIESIYLESFSKTDIELEIKNRPKLVAPLQENGLFDYFLDRIYKETKGIPLLVVQFLREWEWSSLSKEDIDKKPLQIRPQLNSFLVPFYQFSDQPALLQMYGALLIAGVTNMEIDNSQFNVSYFFDSLDTKGTNLDNISQLTLLDVCLMLNCYISPITGKNKFKLLFPQATIETFKKQYNNSQNIVSWFEDQQFPLFNRADSLHDLTQQLLCFKMYWGAAQNLIISEILPFLKLTNVAQLPCIKLNKKYDNFWHIHHTQMQTCISIQVNKLSTEEIEKNEKIRLTVGEDSMLIMIFLSRDNSPPAGTFHQYVNDIPLHRNTTVIVLSREEVDNFYGDLDFYHK